MTNPTDGTAPRKTTPYVNIHASNGTNATEVQHDTFGTAEPGGNRPADAPDFPALGPPAKPHTPPLPPDRNRDLAPAADGSKTNGSDEVSANGESGADEWTEVGKRGKAVGRRGSQ